MGKHILIVEDELLIREMYELVLKEKGFLIDSADNGESALDKLLDPVNRYDLIILDIMLPKIDGITILKKIREDTSPSKDTPVFLLSNLGMDSIVAEAMSLGVRKYIIKADKLPKEIAEEVEKFFNP